jgi:hypothetical protein
MCEELAAEDPSDGSLSGCEAGVRCPGAGPSESAEGADETGVATPPDSDEDVFRTAAEGARSEDDAAGDPEADSPDPEEDCVAV